MTVFICFAPGDSEAVEALARAIERTNREVWLEREFAGGESWWDEVLSQVRSCQVFVFVLSDRSLRSKRCLAEYQYAVDLYRPVVPVLVSDLTISPVATDVALRQFVDYRTADDARRIEPRCSARSCRHTGSVAPEPPTATGGATVVLVPTGAPPRTRATHGRGTDRRGSSSARVRAPDRTDGGSFWPKMATINRSKDAVRS